MKPINRVFAIAALSISLSTHADSVRIGTKDVELSFASGFHGLVETNRIVAEMNRAATDRFRASGLPRWSMARRLVRMNVKSWPFGQFDAPERLWTKINVRADWRIHARRAIYFSSFHFGAPASAEAGAQPMRLPGAPMRPRRHPHSS